MKIKLELYNSHSIMCVVMAFFKFCNKFECTQIKNFIYTGYDLIFLLAYMELKIVHRGLKISIRYLLGRYIRVFLLW